MSQLKAYAKVQVTLEISLSDVWPEDTNISQIHKQATDSAIDAIRGGLTVNGFQATTPNFKNQASVVGIPEVTTILVKRA